MKGGRETWAKVKKANLFPASPAVPERQTTHCPYKRGFNVVKGAWHEVELISYWVLYVGSKNMCAIVSDYLLVVKRELFKTLFKESRATFKARNS